MSHGLSLSGLTSSIGASGSGHRVKSRMDIVSSGGSAHLGL